MERETREIRAAQPEPEPSGDRPHLWADGDYFCPAHGIHYALTRADLGVDRCLGCGASVRGGGRADPGE